MKSFINRKGTWAGGILALALTVSIAISINGCTDLGEEVFSDISASQFYGDLNTPAEVMAAIAPVYATLRDFQWDYHQLSEISTDEVVIPVRGSDWLDNGIWLNAHQHTWTPNNDYFNGVYETAFRGISRANLVLQTLEASNVPNKDQLSAELRGLRAFYYYMLMDFFGNVPIVGDEAGEYVIDPKNPPATESRAAVYEFVRSELEAIYDTLPTKSQTDTGRFTKGAADAILANMYLNAAVFTKNSNEISPDSYNSCTTVAGACDAAIAAADRVINSGLYNLPNDWFSSFSPNNSGNPDHIFAIGYLAQNNLGLQFEMKTLHYNQFTPSPWNGYATIAETYHSFDDADVRKDIFLVGPAPNYNNPGEPVFDRQGKPLVFTPEIGSIENAGEHEGARIMKFPVDPDHFEQHMGNDYPIFRLAEMYLIKAEALNENGDPGGAILILNMLREKVYDPDQPLDAGMSQAQAREAILEERLHELFYEAKRRQDLVRFGQYTSGTWWEKDVSDGSRVLFPLPQRAIDANPNLTQNPGYN